MSANLVIIQLLHTSSNHAEFLRLCWDNLSAAQKRDIFYFLYNGGQYRTFLTVLRAELNAENPFVPWTHLFSILEKLNKLGPDSAKNFLTTPPAEEFGVFRLRAPELAELWLHKKKLVLKEHEDKKIQLLSALQFAKNQGIREQRNKALDDLRRLFPKDRDVELASHEEKEFRARNTLSKITNRNNQSPQWISKEEKTDKKLLRQMEKDARAALKKNPALGLDIALLFFQMELFPQALKIIDGIERKTAEVRWHELHISIEAKQYARALSTIEILKRKKNTDSEKSFSLLYFQALALHGLGQTAEARQIVKNIVKIRPHFRSATSLLLEWENDK